MRAMEPDTDENGTLVENVHPRGWANPEPAPRYHLVVIGGGTAGLVCAAGASALGARVALIERHLLGGDCLNVGCVPSKAVIRASRAYYEARTSGAFGVTGTQGLSVDFGAAMQRMRQLRARLSCHDAALRFRDELGVDVFFGAGRFVGTDVVEVDGAKLLFRRAAVCTGARATSAGVSGLEEAGYLTNETVFSLTKLPRRLAVIGGGPIGCELAQAFARFGSQVTVIEQGGQILGREDADVAGILQQALVADGVDLRLGRRILSAARRGTERVLKLMGPEEAVEEVIADEILLGIGRAPNLEGLELERGEIEYDRNGITVDDRLRTTNRRVFAAGDICSAFKFTHTADAQARIVIGNALFGGRRKNSMLVVPWCTYTDPEVAHVGMTEAQAKGKGMEVTTLTVPLCEVDRAVLDGEAGGLARVHLKKGSDRILGATVVARHAGEMIGELTLAMTAGLGLKKIGETIHPYPTQAEAVRKLADAYNRSRLTPGAMRVIKKVLSVLR